MKMRVKKKRWILYLIMSLIIVKIGRLVFHTYATENGQDTDTVSDLESTREEEKWLQNLKASRSDEIPTVIVEEHYEVLQYWFQAAELDFIPKSSNVLLHIDGHVDGAFPSDVESIPWFRFPRNSDEVYRMMQRNDMFIVAAALTGFIDHVIWVWPTWDEVNHGDEDWTHLSYEVEIGLAETISRDGQSLKISYLCFCWIASNVNRNNSDDNQWDCRIRNTTCYEGDQCPMVQRQKCIIHSKAVLEIVSESVANSVLSRENWAKDKGFILDIDEDFFGCWSDVIPLYEAGVVQKNIDVLSELVSSLFCVSTAEGELQVDRVYVAIIALIKTLKAKSCLTQNVRRRDIRCLRLVEIENFLTQDEDEIIEFFKSKQSTDIFCESEEKAEGLFFQSLLHFLLNFSTEQLTLLEELGICLGVSPSSPNFFDDGKFHVCHGDNIPNRTLVPFHLPTEQEVNFRAMKLKQMLSSVVKRPDLITVSRSVRDGYTPKKLFHLLESKLFNSITRSYRKVNISGVFYDPNLLGGKNGWDSRSQPLVPQILEYLRLK